MTTRKTMTTKQIRAALLKHDTRLRRERDDLRDLLTELSEKEAAVAEACTALGVCIEELEWAGS